MLFEFKLPDIGEGVVEGEIIRWLIDKGDQVLEDQPMVEVMTDKATVEIPSPVSGTVLETRGAEGDVVRVGETMVVIEAEKAPAQQAAPSEAPVRETGPRETAAKGKEVLATPAVRKLARQKGIDLALVGGTGPGGRITQGDVESLAGPGPESDSDVGVETVPYRALRKRIGDHLVAAKRFAPHYTYVEEADATQLVEVREAFLQNEPDARLTYLPFFIKAVVAGLKRFPLLNATLDEEKEQILLKKYYNIGIATATKEGLIVPVVKHADKKGILSLAEEIALLTDRVKDGKAQLEDLRGGTFTITSPGPLGGVLATPIINYPEVAILGIHKIEDRAVVRDGAIVIRKCMNLSLSLDHRVVDGVVGAQFMQFVISYLENPGLLALN